MRAFGDDRLRRDDLRRHRRVRERRRIRFDVDGDRAHLRNRPLNRHRRAVSGRNVTVALAGALFGFDSRMNVSKYGPVAPSAKNHDGDSCVTPAAPWPARPQRRAAEVHRALGQARADRT